jgi:hypothetical protein
MDAERSELDERRQAQGWAALQLWRDGDVNAALTAFRTWEGETPESDRDLNYAIALTLSGLPREGSG